MSYSFGVVLTRLEVAYESGRQLFKPRVLPNFMTLYPADHVTGNL